MFGEKTTEWYKGKELPVWQSPKYQESKQKAIEIIEKYDCIGEGDFWILMNTIKNGETMMYSGLIISHNGCLKINDEQEAERKFNPACVILDKDGYNKSLVYTYCCEEQGLYEVGEVSKDNCKNSYPYAMAYKRLFDRVVLKLCGLAYNGVYSDSEADEFKQKFDAEEFNKKITKSQVKTIVALAEKKDSDLSAICDYFKVGTLEEMTAEQYGICLNMLNHKQDKNTPKGERIITS